MSLEDDLLVRFADPENPDINSAQRIAEDQNLQIRDFLWKYEGVVEQHRREVFDPRHDVLLSPDWTLRSWTSEEQYADLARTCGHSALEDAGREIVLAILEDLWADYLASVGELKGGIHWVSWGGGDPLHRFLSGVQQIYTDFWDSLYRDIAGSLEKADIRDGKLHLHNAEQFERGATWTYLTTDQPFGTATERLIAGLRRKFSKDKSTPPRA